MSVWGWYGTEGHRVHKPTTQTSTASRTPFGTIRTLAFPTTRSVCILKTSHVVLKPNERAVSRISLLDLPEGKVIWLLIRDAARANNHESSGKLSRETELLDKFNILETAQQTNDQGGGKLLTDLVLFWKRVGNENVSETGQKSNPCRC